MWSMQNGKFTYREVPYTPHVFHHDSTPAASVVSSGSHTHAVAGIGNTTADTGTFVDVDGLPANGSPVAGIAQAGQIVSSGVVDAYVVDMPARAKLSGVYDKTINGTAAGKVIIIYNELDNSFIMASTKSNELESLKLQFESLTGS